MPPLILIPALLLLFVAFILIRTLLFTRSSGSQYIPFTTKTRELEIDPLIPSEHLSSVVQIQTISHEDPSQNKRENFVALHAQLEKMYPRLHAVLSKELLDEYSLLYTWPGKDPSLDPVVFMAHQDVVPADENSLDKWLHPPFSGRIADGYIWGRGTLDIKSQLIGILEAVENLIKNNYVPERTILLAFGHDEEVLGTGAKAIVAHLKEKGVRLQAVLDEGGAVYKDFLPGIKGNAAVIGLAEKGYLSLKFTVNAAGGHASTPMPETAIGILAKGIDRLQTHLFPQKISAVLPLFKGLSASIPPLMQMAFANAWLFGGLLRTRLSHEPKTDATIRTTTAPTIFHSGIKDNVLPSLAEAVINFRILPGESIAQVCERVRRVIDDDRITFEPVKESATEPSPISPADSKAYRHIASVTDELFSDTLPAPYIMLGCSDARNYYQICSQVYRFNPLIMTKEAIDGIHGLNERISVEAMGKIVQYFYRLIQRWASEDM